MILKEGVTSNIHPHSEKEREKPLEVENIKEIKGEKLDSEERAHVRQ